MIRELIKRLRGGVPDAVEVMDDEEFEALFEYEDEGGDENEEREEGYHGEYPNDDGESDV